MAETAFEEKTPASHHHAHMLTHTSIHLHMHVHKKYPHELTHMFPVLENSKFMLCDYLTASSFKIIGVSYFCCRKLAPSLSFGAMLLGVKSAAGISLTAHRQAFVLPLLPAIAQKAEFITGSLQSCRS